jgi:methionine synthase / methylenetetrahydrofolate reductase (NADH)
LPGPDGCPGRRIQGQPPALPRCAACPRAEILREQIATLCDWVDLLILETFGDLESLVQAVEVARSESGLPVVAQLTFGGDGRTLRGEDPAETAAVLSDLRAPTARSAQRS